MRPILHFGQGLEKLKHVDAVNDGLIIQPTLLSHYHSNSSNVRVKGIREKGCYPNVRVDRYYLHPNGWCFPLPLLVILGATTATLPRQRARCSTDQVGVV
ncbi:unnamed protein product [Ectocarpus fasciculatus]